MGTDHTAITPGTEHLWYLKAAFGGHLQSKLSFPLALPRDALL